MLNSSTKEDRDYCNMSPELILLYIRGPGERQSCLGFHLAVVLLDWGRGGRPSLPAISFPCFYDWMALHVVRCTNMQFMIVCLLNCHHVCLAMARWDEGEFLGQTRAIKWCLLVQIMLGKPKRTCTFDSLGHESPHEVGTEFTPVWPPKRMDLEHRTQPVSVIYAHSLVKYSFLIGQWRFKGGHCF